MRSPPQPVDPAGALSQGTCGGELQSWVKVRVDPTSIVWVATRRRPVPWTSSQAPPTSPVPGPQGHMRPTTAGSSAPSARRGRGRLNCAIHQFERTHPTVERPSRRLSRASSTAASTRGFKLVAIGLFVIFHVDKAHSVVSTRTGSLGATTCGQPDDEPAARWARMMSIRVA